MKNYKIYLWLLIAIGLGYLLLLKNNAREEMTGMLNFSYLQISKFSILALMAITLTEYMRLRMKPARGIKLSNYLLGSTVIPIIIFFLTPLIIRYLSIAKIQSGEQTVNWLLELIRNYINPAITVMVLLFVLSQVALVFETFFSFLNKFQAKED